MKIGISKLKIYIGFLLIAFIVVIVYAVSMRTESKIPVIVAANPQSGSNNVGLHAFPIIIFDKEILEGDFKISSEPQVTWIISQNDATSITLSHTPGFQPATKYTIKVSWREKELPPITYTTQQIQEDPQLIDKMKNELERDYPLGQLTPYETNSYWVVYSAPLTFEITMKNNALSEEEVTLQLRNWVKVNGGDPNKHAYMIKPFVSTPTPVPSLDEEE